MYTSTALFYVEYYLKVKKKKKKGVAQDIKACNNVQRVYNKLIDFCCFIFFSF